MHRCLIYNTPLRSPKTKLANRGVGVTLCWIRDDQRLMKN
jgi:hypothetical protein